MVGGASARLKKGTYDATHTTARKIKVRTTDAAKRPSVSDGFASLGSVLTESGEPPPKNRYVWYADETTAAMLQPRSMVTKMPAPSTPRFGGLACKRTSEKISKMYIDTMRPRA